MPVAANHGTDIITKIVPIRPPIWRGIRPSHSTTPQPHYHFGSRLLAVPDDPPLKTLRKRAPTEADAPCAVLGLQLAHERGGKLTQLGRVLLGKLGKLSREFESALMTIEPTEYERGPKSAADARRQASCARRLQRDRSTPRTNGFLD